VYTRQLRFCYSAEAASQVKCPRINQYPAREPNMCSRFRLIACLILVVASFALLLEVRADDAAKSHKDASEPQSKFASKLLDGVKDYERFGRVDDEARWAPFLCRQPLPAKAWFSKSDDADTHGQKLYSLFAKDRKAYISRPSKPAPLGQIIVKESWIPEEVKSKEEKEAVLKDPFRIPASTKRSPANIFDHFSPYAGKDGKIFKASKKAGLFVMMKLDPKTPDTDMGWVYGTVSADAKTVTAAGKIATCMECHVKAKNDRLFGLAGK
jgi:hypothetical protein